MALFRTVGTSRTLERWFEAIARIAHAPGGLVAAVRMLDHAMKVGDIEVEPGVEIARRMKQLRLKLGELPPSVETRIGSVTTAELDRFAERILTAERLDDVLR